MKPGQLDTEAMATPVTLAEVTACIEVRPRRAACSKRLESLFQAQRRSYRARSMRSGILPAVLFYNAFIPVHFFLLPQTVWLALILHAIVTAGIVTAGFILRTEPSTAVRETIAVAIPGAMTGQILTILLLNSSEAAEHYQYLAIMIVVYMNVNVRPDFRYAFGASVALGLVYGVALGVDDAPVAAKLIGCASMLTAIHLSLVANWRMEQDARHTFLRRLQDQLRREEAEAEAERDALTGLGNRRAFDQATSRLWSEADPTSLAALIMVDVDHFKAFNDRYGHPAGDLCLKRVASAIRSAVSDTAQSLVVRFGGEEFVVLLSDADLSTALRGAEHIRRAVEGLAIPHAGISAGGQVTVSLGVMAGPIASHPPIEMLTGADTALYAAKRAGRNQVWPPRIARSSEVAKLRRERSR